METHNVGFDVLFEILSRVDLKTLRRCRILSKECNNISYESHLMQLHCQKTKTISGYFIQSINRNKYYSTFLSNNLRLDHDLKLSLDFLPERSVKILATVDQGLMFCIGQGSIKNRYYICKPSTKQWEIIPSPNPRYFTETMAMVVLRSNPLKFKIVRHSAVEFDYNHQLFHVEIFYSDIWIWKQLDDLRLFLGEHFDRKQPAISACGGLHWLISGTQGRRRLASFYGDKETWQLVPLPKLFCETTFPYQYLVKLADYNGKLAILRYNVELLELWVSIGDNKVWSRRHILDLKSLNNQIGLHIF